MIFEYNLKFNTHIQRFSFLTYVFVYYILTGHHGAPDSVANFSALSNRAEPRMFPVWDFVEGIFERKAMLNMGQVLPILICQYLYSI